ncbi:hypothetical protein [Thermococcus piezophilus]|uniref:Uncharacterized protein n=1 Tax=Thermococcus piezophilus TaxID=1712654 RepID=A0A172WGJ0_9EURY|nr:hypothetical protein [Thermococcus piezophilus]ANF22416.1 hypothetical protein A7C91_03955 [Thermococcus piezophilus]
MLLNPEGLFYFRLEVIGKTLLRVKMPLLRGLIEAHPPSCPPDMGFLIGALTLRRGRRSDGVCINNMGSITVNLSS